MVLLFHHCSRTVEYCSMKPPSFTGFMCFLGPLWQGSGFNTGSVRSPAKRWVLLQLHTRSRVWSWLQLSYGRQSHVCVASTGSAFVRPKIPRRTDPAPRWSFGGQTRRGGADCRLRGEGRGCAVAQLPGGWLDYLPATGRACGRRPPQGHGLAGSGDYCCVLLPCRRTVIERPPAIAAPPPPRALRFLKEASSLASIR